MSRGLRTFDDRCIERAGAQLSDMRRYLDIVVLG